MKTPEEFAENFFDEGDSYRTRSLTELICKRDAEVLQDAADAVPVDLWCTYGMVARVHVEEFQQWLRERADKGEQR